jgi:hypothetical protein
MAAEHLRIMKIDPLALWNAPVVPCHAPKKERFRHRGRPPGQKRIVLPSQVERMMELAAKIR